MAITKIIGGILIAGGLTMGWFMNNIADSNANHSYVVKFQRGETPGIDYSDIMLDVVEQLERNPDYHVILIGHTGTRGPTASNEELGFKRARRLERDLKFQGISSDRIHVMSLGETALLTRDDHETDALWQKRLSRVEVMITVDSEAFPDE